MDELIEDISNPWFVEAWCCAKVQQTLSKIESIICSEPNELILIRWILEHLPLQDVLRSRLASLLIWIWD